MKLNKRQIKEKINDFKEVELKDLKENRDSNIEATLRPCRSKQAKKKRDDDFSNGMKKWIKDYHQSKPGLEVLQNQIDHFVTDYEEKLQEERKAKEALVAEGGWTVVQHHKGRKKTTDSESGIVVGSVAQAAVENKLAKKKPQEVGLDL